MSQRGREKDRLAHVVPEDLSAYLRAHEWVQQEPIGERPMVLWTRSNATGSETEVSVPVHARWRDYEEQVRRIVESVARAESRPPEAVLRELAFVGKDVLRFRASGQATENGTISLRGATLLAECAQRAVTAAACTTVAPRRSVPKHKPQEVLEYLRAVRVGQTERGSYVYTVVSPVREPPDPLQPTLPAVDVDAYVVEESFARRTVTTLVGGLVALSSATKEAMKSGDLSAFERAVEVGVSSDLCNAIAHLDEDHEVSALGIHVEWSPARRPKATVPETGIQFGREAFEVLRTAAHHIKSRGVDASVDLVGAIVDVSRPNVLLGGTVIVVGHVDGVPRRVQLDLYGEDFTAAAAAIADKSRGLWFRCRGDLELDRKPARLVNVHKLEWVALDALDDDDLGPR